MSPEVQTISIVRLNPESIADHPKNSVLYGQLVIDDLMRIISRPEDIHPVIVWKKGGEYISIGGHRRKKVAIAKGFEWISCEIREFANEWEALEMLIKDNIYRPKTNWMITNEMALLKEVEAARAKIRQESGKVVPESERGRAAEIAGKKAGMSKSTFYEARKVVEEINRFESEGETERAEALKEILNQSVDGAKKAIPVIGKMDKTTLRSVKGDRLREIVNYSIKPEFALNNEIICNLFISQPITAGKKLTDQEFLQWSRLFGVQPMNWLLRPIDQLRMAYVIVLTSSPKAQEFKRVYFFSNSANEILFNHDIESKLIFEFCQWFGLGAFQNKEEAAKKLSNHMLKIKHQ